MQPRKEFTRDIFAYIINEEKIKQVSCVWRTCWYFFNSGMPYLLLLLEQEKWAVACQLA